MPPLTQEPLIYNEPSAILTPRMDFRDHALVVDNLEWQKGLLNDGFGELANLNNLSCDTDMAEDPEWTKRIFGG